MLGRVWTSNGEPLQAHNLPNHLGDSQRQTTVRNGTELSLATCGTVQLNLLKIGALITTSVRRVKIVFTSSCAHEAVFAKVYHRLR
jgi:hypothetical protein